MGHRLETATLLSFCALLGLGACDARERPRGEAEGETGARERRTEPEPTPGTETASAAATAPDTDEGDATPSPLDAESFESSYGLEPHFGFTRRRRIADLRGVDEPSSADAGESPPSTMALPRRSKGGRRPAAPGVTIRTRCGERYCIDGLLADERTLLDAVPVHPPEEGGRLERILRVTWVTDEYISGYIATSQYFGGAANAENELRCRTWDRKTGDEVTLGELLEESTAERLLKKARALTEPKRAMAELATVLEAEGVEFRPPGYRLARTKGYVGADPEIVLCGNDESAGGGESILEMRVEEFPVGFLLRPLAPDAGTE